MSAPANGTPGKSSPQLPRGVLARSGTPFPPGARLPSLRAPRDLTLSGSAQKRTFVPNVSAPRRTPNKDNDTGPNVAEGGRPGRGSHRGGRGGERGRGRGGRGRGQLIQTQGATFADGLGEATRRPGARHSVASDSVSAPEKPKYTPHRTLTAKEKQEDDKRLALLLRSDFIDDGDQEVSKLNPVTLPLISVKKEEEDDKKQVVVKKEKLDPDKEEEEAAVPPPSVKGEPRVGLIRAPMAELCMDPNLPEVGQLLFFQFPDTLPGLVPEQQAPKSKPAQVANPAAPPPKTAEPEQKDPGKRLTLADFPEGYVGKLQVLRSGRSRLLLGSVALTLERGTLVSFQQDLASLTVTPEEGGHLTILGQVPHKLICLPDVQALLGAYVKTL